MDISIRLSLSPKPISLAALFLASFLTCVNLDHACPSGAASNVSNGEGHFHDLAAY